MINHLKRETLSTILKGPLPGEPAQRKLAPELRGHFKHDENCQAAAVLIVLFPDKNSIRTVFIKRNEYDGPHSGQISFPGGIYEDEDQNLTQTALRETEEETGIKAKKIEVLGRLTPLFIPVSNICVTPYVGWMTERPEFNPDSSEVQYLLTPNLDELLDPANRRKEIIYRHGQDIFTPYILIEQDILWGATAMILSEFMELIDW